MLNINTDVIVIGGGSAGCFAAICAANTGAKTLLVEKNGMLGGTTTTGRVNFPGLFHAWGKQIIDGPCWESIERCVQRGGATLPPFPYKSEHHNMQQILLDVFTYACVLDDMCEEAGVDVLLHSMVADVTEERDGVRVTLATKNGMRAVDAKVLIDATGDADALRIAGCEYEVSEQLQPATLIHDLGGYDPEAIDADTLRAYLAAVYESGELTLEDSQGRDIAKMVKKGRIHMHIDAPEAHTSEGKTALEIKARRRLAKILSCLSKFEGLEDIRAARFASECGVRETVRIVGEHRISADEYLSGEVTEDSVCYAFYPIDLHQSTGIYQIFVKEDTVPTVSYGALVPKGKTRMLCAGRCICSDTNANSALRVQATCMATGQVAGVAAAICASDGSALANVSMDKLKASLRAIGAIVPGDISFK